MAPKVVMTMADWRLNVLLEPERTGQTVTEVCRRHEISRDTFYSWKRRFEAVGVMGLLERSRTPLRQPRRVSLELEELICEMRRSHRRWGARTIRTRLRRKGLAVPAISTVHRVLTRNGLVEPNPHNKPRSSFNSFERPEPNDLWQMDGTEIKLLSGAKAVVVSVLDDHARFMLAGIASPVENGATTWSAFHSAAQAYGLPRQIYTDNHLGFTGRLRDRKVVFEQRVERLGVGHIPGAPHNPQARGKIERFHQTLQQFVADEGGAMTVDDLQVLVDRFRHDYNTDRPHQGIGDITPAERYRPSPRALGHAEDLVDPDYPPGAIIRKVSSNGVVCWNYIRIALGTMWGGRRVEVVPDNGWIHIHFGDLVVRSVEHHQGKTNHPLPRRKAG